MRLDLQAETGVGEAGDGVLCFRPFQDRQIPRGPILDLSAVRIILIAQAQEDEVSAMARGESGDLEVVPQQCRRSRQLVLFALEELALVIVARSPIQHGSDAQTFAENVPHHVFRLHALGRALVVAAARGVNVVIA